MRRSFLAYLERERVHPYRPFLHYNSWYDLGYFTPYTEKDALDVIDAFGRELVEKRHVTLSSFLFDDGWDSHKTLWKFNDGFPNGFTPLKAAAAKYGAAPGVWMSPFGGYGDPRRERLEYGKTEGFETNERGFALSGPVYYKRFHDTCVEMITKYGINQFKFDGIGRATGVVAGSQFGSDFEAAIHLIRDDLRAIKPDIFINLTTGTWPSPFWLGYADTIWRGGEDHSFAGVGTKRQQWMTYRDAQTYKNVVTAGPAVSADVVDAARVDLRAGRQGPEHRSGRRLHVGGALVLRDGHRAAGDVHHAVAPHREELGRDRAVGDVGARQRGCARGHALDRRRSREARGVRPCGVGAAAGHRGPAQSGGQTRDVRSRRHDARSS